MHYQCKMLGDDEYDDWVFDDDDEGIDISKEQIIESYVMDQEMELSGEVVIREDETGYESIYWVDVIKYPTKYKVRNALDVQH